MHLSRLGINSEPYSASHLKMTQAKMSFSPPFVDFGYEPGTLVLDGNA
ncbi:hypothetical protein IQ244_16085 [Nostoc sp. LEGE 06077]|nr:hypothetical protein [Nostoc sp. LEGE 06077]